MNNPSCAICEAKHKCVVMESKGVKKWRLHGSLLSDSILCQAPSLGFLRFYALVVDF